MKELSYKLFFKALSNTTRFEIIKLLKKRPKNVTEISEALGFEQSRISHNLKCLENCGFVNSKYNGKSRIYSLDPEIVAILNAIDKHIVKYHEWLRTCGVLEKNRITKTLLAIKVIGKNNEAI